MNSFHYINHFEGSYIEFKIIVTYTFTQISAQYLNQVILDRDQLISYISGRQPF